MKITGRPPKLSAIDVVMARSLFKGGMQKQQIARRFGVANKTITQYLRGDHKNPALVAVSPYPL